MVWGAMATQGLGNLAKLDGGVNSELYLEVFEENLKEAVSDFGFKGKDWMIQQDNAPCHSSKVTKDWFAKNLITVLDWPAQSPDLNPIEHLWAHLKKQIGKLPRVTSVANLWEKTQDEWLKIPPEVCASLVNSMSRRCEAVRKARGGYTRY